MTTWIRRLRARRRLRREDALLALERRTRGIESECAYLRETMRRCAAESAACPDDAHDWSMAQLADQLRLNTELLRRLTAEELELRRRLGITS